MKAFIPSLLIVTLFACNGREAGPGAKTQAPPAAPKDPVFVQVDRDQLKALCLQRLLPRTHERANYAAVVLSDGTRLPWLAFTATEQNDPTLNALDWLKDEAEVLQSLGDTNQSVSMERLYRLCPDGEQTVVVTGIFADKAGFHIVGTRGRKQATKDLPPTAKPQEAYALAFALIESLVGQPVTIARHPIKAAGSAGQATVDDDRWLNAGSAAQ